MRLFEGDPYSGYERIKRASPDFMDEVLEAQALWRAVGEEHDEIRACIVALINNLLIRYADEFGIAEWEDFLEISYDGPLPDLEFRRAMVIATLLGQHHIGRPEIKEMLRRFTDADESSVRFRFGTIEINVDGVIRDKPAFFKLLRQKIPTHLGLDASQYFTIRRPLRLAPTVRRVVHRTVQAGDSTTTLANHMVLSGRVTSITERVADGRMTAAGNVQGRRVLAARTNGMPVRTIYGGTL